MKSIEVSLSKKESQALAFIIAFFAAIAMVFLLTNTLIPSINSSRWFV